MGSRQGKSLCLPRDTLELLRVTGGMRFIWTSSPVFRLINVDFDSLRPCATLPCRADEILVNVLREPGCSGRMIAGDFNAVTSKDDGLVDKNGLVDAWVVDRIGLK